MIDDSELPDLRPGLTIVEKASDRLDSAFVRPPNVSIASFDEESVVISASDGIAAEVEALIAAALGSIPHQIVHGPRQGAILYGPGGNPEDIPGYAEFQLALHAQNFCDGYELTAHAVGKDGPVSFDCHCGRFSTDYADIVTANAVLDEHLAEHGRTRRLFSDRWWADHRGTGS